MCMYDNSTSSGIYCERAMNSMTNMPRDSLTDALMDECRHGILCRAKESCSTECVSYGIVLGSRGLGCGGGKRCIGRKGCGAW